jgi:hypothetical protein
MTVPQPFQYQGSQRALAPLILQYLPVSTTRLAGCAGPRPTGDGVVKVVVSGSAGQAFTGTCSGRTWSGRSFAQDFKGIVPAEFTFVAGSRLDFSIQKSGQGNLMVGVHSTVSESVASTVTGTGTRSHGVRDQIRPWRECIQTF